MPAEEGGGGDREGRKKDGEGRGWWGSVEVSFCSHWYPTIASFAHLWLADLS